MLSRVVCSLILFSILCLPPSVLADQKVHIPSEDYMDRYESKMLDMNKNLDDISGQLLDSNEQEYGVSSKLSDIAGQNQVSAGHLNDLIYLYKNMSNIEDRKLVLVTLKRAIKYFRKMSDRQTAYINKLITGSANIALISEGQRLRDSILELQQKLSD